MSSHGMLMQLMQQNATARKTTLLLWNSPLLPESPRLSYDYQPKQKCTLHLNHEEIDGVPVHEIDEQAMLVLIRPLNPSSHSGENCRRLPNNDNPSAATARDSRRIFKSKEGTVNEKAMKTAKGASACSQELAEARAAADASDTVVTPQANMTWWLSSGISLPRLQHCWRRLRHGSSSASAAGRLSAESLQVQPNAITEHSLVVLLELIWFFLLWVVAPT